MHWQSYKLGSGDLSIDIPHMENLFRSIQSLQERLLENEIPSIVIGGVAVAAWGEPRVTRDVDLKILLGREDAIAYSKYFQMIINPLYRIHANRY